jgi:hypothetical protein
MVIQILAQLMVDLVGEEVVLTMDHSIQEVEVDILEVMELLSLIMLAVAGEDITQMVQTLQTLVPTLAMDM